MEVGEDEDAREKFEQCLAIAQTIVHHELESECERYLGELALDTGDLQAARARFMRSLEVCLAVEDKRNEAMALWCLGRHDFANGDLELARSRLANALRAFESFQMTSELLDCLEDYAGILRTGIARTDDTVRLLSAATSIREQLAISCPRRSESRRRASIEAARAALGENAFNAAWVAGREWGLRDAIKHVLEEHDQCCARMS